jgi:glutathione reductase (NADPH)
MWNLASHLEDSHYMEHYHVKSENKLDFAKFKEARDGYIKRLNTIYENNVAGSNVDYVRGMAKFVSPTSIQVEGKEYSAKHILIASGATPAKDNFEGSELCMNSDGFFEMNTLPESVVVLGGGYIAVELGQMLAGLGVKDVTIVARSSLLKFLDN